MFKHKIYYGHVDGLGYVMAEDEFETDENGKILDIEFANKEDLIEAINRRI